MISRASDSMSSRAACAGRVSAAWRSSAESVSQSRMRIALGQHLLDRQHEQRAGAGLLQALERLPEDVLAADRVHGYPVGEALERNDGGRLAAGQELADLGESAARCMQHDVFALTHLLYTVE